MARRFWKIDRGNGVLSLAVSTEGDLRTAFPNAEELTEVEYGTEAAAVQAAAAKPDPIVTPMIGNKVTHATNPDAKRVVVLVNAPSGGPKRARPTINGVSVISGEYAYDRPGKAITVKTRAGNNDLLVTEEF